jgi:hypothetical protein
MTTTRRLMLGDLIHAVSTVAVNDQEVLATLSHLVNSGRIQLGKTSAWARLDLLPRSRKVTGVVLHK